VDDARSVIVSLSSPKAPTLPYLLAAVRFLEHQHDWAAIHGLLENRDELVSQNWLLTYSHASALGKLGRPDDAVALIERSRAGYLSSRSNLKASTLIGTRRHEDAARCLREIWEGPDIGRISPELVVPLTDAAWEAGGPGLGHAVLDRIASEAPRNKSGEILLLLSSVQRAKLRFLTGLFASPPRLMEPDIEIERRVYQQLSTIPEAEPALGPVREMTRLYMRLRSSHPAFFPNPSSFLSDALEVAVRIIDAAEAKRPLSLIRLGDGEGNFLPYRSELEAFHLSDRVETQYTWWGEDAPAPSDVESLQQLLWQAIRSADIVGIPDLGRVCRTMLNYPIRASYDGGRNADGGRSARGLLASIEAATSGNSTISSTAAVLTSCHVHQSLSFWGLWDLLFARFGTMSLISCHANLPKVLVDRYGVDIERAYLIPPERKYAGAFDQTHDGRHYPDVFEELRIKLSCVKPGQVFLVGAGMLGKIYCTWVKQAGGIAIDIGSAADFWCGHQTRGLADIATYRSPGGVAEQLRLLVASHPRYCALLGSRIRDKAAAAGI
jgi:hypothetical protein